MLANLFADFDADRQQKMRFAAPRFFDAAQDVLLRLGTESRQRRDASFTRGGFEFIEIADAEFLVQNADLFQSKLRHAQQFEDSGRILRAQLGEILRLTGADQLQNQIGVFLIDGAHDYHGVDEGFGLLPQFVVLNLGCIVARAHIQVSDADSGQLKIELIALR